MSIILNNTYSTKSTYASLGYCSYVKTLSLYLSTTHKSDLWLWGKFWSVCSVMSDSLQHFGLYPTRLVCPWDFPGKNTAGGCHFLLQEIFLTQKSKLGVSHLCIGRWVLYLCAIWEAPIFEDSNIFQIPPWYMDHISLKCVSSNLQSEELTTYSRDLPIFNAQYCVGGWYSWKNCQK